VSSLATRLSLGSGSPDRHPGVFGRILVTNLLAVTISFPVVADMEYLIERPTVELSLEYQQKDENRSGPGVDPRNEQLDTFWQSLELRSRGWVYHPDLLLFSFGVEPQWKKRDTTASDFFVRNDDDKFLGYFVDAHLLRQKLHSLKVFVRQSRNEFNSTLSPDNITETEIARAVWLINSESFPTALTLESNDILFEDFFSTRDKSDILRLETKFTSEKHQLNFLSEYVDQFRKIDVQEFDVKRSLVTLNSNYVFSEGARLTSTIFSLDSVSDITDSKSFLWSERLMFQHRPNLRSDFLARLDSRGNDSFSSDAAYLSGAIEHQLYENLTTRIEAYTSQDKFDDGEIDIQEADLSFRYARKIPVGMLTMTNGYLYRIEDNNIDASSSQVIGEVHALVGISPELLDRTQIELSSVIVSDISRTTTYIEGIDYVLTEVGESVTIERRLFGGIADGESVLIDYTYATREPFKASRGAARFGVNLDLWRSLRLYYNFSRIKEDLISGTRPSDLSDDRIQRVGASFRWRWSTTTADYELRDTVRTPLSRRRLQQSFAIRISRAMSFGLSASYADTNFEDAGSDTRTIGLSGNIRWDLGHWGRLEVDAFSRDIDGESQKTRSEGLISKWSLRYGDWSGFLRYEVLDEVDDLTIQIRDRRLMTLRVSRTFR